MIFAIEYQIGSIQFVLEYIFDVDDESEGAPAVKLTNMVLSEAVQKGASDIHIEPMEDRLNIRFRIDGVLQNQPSPPKRIQSSFLSRLKVMGDMDISERRLPQDGRTKIQVGDRELDIRISSIPTVYGEKIVLRLLDPKGLQLDMAELGMEPRELDLIQKNIKAANGMILVTGPTGSGKTTTLYSALSNLNSPDTNIVTIEDPVEYLIKGINQVQAKSDIGLNFATGLRSFLRQDPDVIMVGEIRDKETGEIAGNAALTGHLVLSTLHTNDAPSTVIRLLNMGMEPVLIAATLRLVIAQRLLRRICKECTTLDDVTPSDMLALGMDFDSSKRIQMKKGRGCDICHGTGYKGRMGIYEVLEINEEMRQLIVRKASPTEIN